MRARPTLLAAAVLALAATACTSGGRTTATPRDDNPRGGTPKVVLSKRIVAFSLDQFANLPALDRVALRPGS